MELRFLDERDRSEVHATFRRAFADYAVDADFDAPTLNRLMARRGADLARSVGAFDGDRMVAVMATAVRRFEGILTAYDVFTGVEPEHRGRGLAGAMLEFARAELGRIGVHRFLLEVIESNSPAIRAYERAGFSTRRRLKCFEVPGNPLPAPAGSSPVEIRRTEAADWPRWARWRSWPPSWQNDEDSIDGTSEETVVLRARSGSRDVGFAIVVPSARDLPQLAVHPGWRRRGIGTRLLDAALSELERDSTLRVINVDGEAAPDLSFYGRFGRNSLPAQREMVLEFGS
jgi:ribosomal protein S18 acetylase RimI-like enzyme